MLLLDRLAIRHSRLWAVLRETIAGVFRLGFVHAGNLAYLSLLTLFPFAIVVVTVAGSLGRTADGVRAIAGFLGALPPPVAALLEAPIAEVVGHNASSGLLTLGLLVTLWSVTGFIETIRAIIREAYGAVGSASWQHRAGSLLVVFVAVFAMLAALAAQVFLSGAETFVAQLMPFTGALLPGLGLQRLVPAAIIFGSIWSVFFVLTPKRYRAAGAPIWPGAAVVTLTWVGSIMALPPVLARMGNYTLTYGSLAGVIVALLFFYIIGLSLVVGANLNAALAKLRTRQLKELQASLR